MAEAQNNNQQNQEQDLNQILKARREKLAALQEAGKDPFQITKYDVTHYTFALSSEPQPGHERDVYVVHLALVCISSVLGCL